MPQTSKIDYILVNENFKMKIKKAEYRIIDYDSNNAPHSPLLLCVTADANAMKTARHKKKPHLPKPRWDKADTTLFVERLEEFQYRGRTSL